MVKTKKRNYRAIDYYKLKWIAFGDWLIDLAQTLEI